jgi:hypothetical protein
MDDNEAQLHRRKEERIEYSIRPLPFRPSFFVFAGHLLGSRGIVLLFCTPSSLTCFCAAFFFVAFGDLSPILFGPLLFAHPLRCET